MTTKGTARFIDTHAHVDDSQFAEDREAVLARAVAARVGRVINIGYCPAHWETTLTLAATFPMVSFTLGTHPQHAAEWTTATRSRLIHLLDSTDAVAVGEIGIDLFRDGASLSVQRTAFEEQLDIAQERNLPVVIHQRAAEKQVWEVLQRRDRSLHCILHSFEGSPELAEFGLDRGYSFGVGGLMTRQSQANLRAVLASVPLEHILLETDSPYLVPAGIRDRRNEPANIPTIAARLAELLGTTVEHVAQTTTRRAQTIFGLDARVEARTVVSSK